MVTSFRELIVWKKAMQLCKEVYRVTEQFPKDERFGLTSQVRRAVVSIASNIAEGQGRSSPADFVRFLYMARGSVHEVMTQLVLANMLGMLPDDSFCSLEMQTEEVARLLFGLIRSLDH